mmetsp:Transcript_4505/g.6884  ORF Transcript_4505/g.6884 Transcript_4505/m.6884 type:complete len:727 (-) Transcript_4505:134-2314(-)
MQFRKMMGKRGNVKSSFLFWTLLALAWATAIVSMTYSYNVSDRHLSVHADESKFRYRDDVEVRGEEEIADADDMEIKKCALLFFGSLGEGFETLSLPSIQLNIIQTNPNCDIFLHTYADTEKQWKKAKLLTDNNLYVYVEEMDSFQEKSRSFLETAGKYYNRSPQEHEKMIQEWHSIQKVWGLMETTEGGKRKYAQVGLFQSNIYYASPIDISHSTAALPNHSHYGGYNKRMFYGSRHNAKVWSFRFSFADRFEKKYMLKFSEDHSGVENLHIGYHPESYLHALFHNHGVKVEPKSICTWKIIDGRQLKVDDCDELEEFASRHFKVEHLPIGLVLNAKETLAFSIQTIQEENEEEEYECQLKQPSNHTHALARFVVFQRDLGHKLQDLIAHYTKVVSYDSIVIIDHNGISQSAQLDLQHYANKGAHVWRCEGSFDYKAHMWSDVVAFYKNESDFLFPIDGDEYMTVLREEGDDGGSHSLHWTHDNLSRELKYLGEVGKKGLPFKTIRSVPIPGDCNMEDHPGMALMGGEHKGHAELAGKNDGVASSPMCRLQYTASDKRHYCYNKCFYRGNEFEGVDKGNHGIPEFLKSCIHEYGFWRDPSSDGVWPIATNSTVDATFNLSNLTLLHLQTNGFSDFVLHRLRGASDKGFNRIDNGVDDHEPCDPNENSGHYCDGWNAFVGVSFDYYKLKEMYQKEVCMNYDPQISMLLPLNEAFGALCNSVTSRVE